MKQLKGAANHIRVKLEEHVRSDLIPFMKSDIVL